MKCDDLRSGPSPARPARTLLVEPERALANGLPGSGGEGGQATAADRERFARDTRIIAEIPAVVKSIFIDRRDGTACQD